MEKPINAKRRYSLKLKAEQAYLQGRYVESAHTYSRILAEKAEDLECRVGLLLADIALDHEEESKALYDYYQLLKRQKPQEAHRVMLELMESFDGNLNALATVAQGVGGEAEAVRGILYSDFKRLVEDRGAFKQAFEDLMFSTKIIISNKEEFLEFLNALAENGFSDLALNYLESSGATLLYDPRFQRLYARVARQ